MLPFGLSKEEAAQSIGCKVGHFSKLVNQGVMPQPKMLGAKKVWYTAELQKAFEALPSAGGIALDDEANEWDED